MRSAFSGKTEAKNVAGFFRESAPRQWFVGGQNIADLLAYLQRWMQGRGRFLRDQADASAANFP